MSHISSEELAVSYGWKILSTFLVQIGRQTYSLPEKGVFVNDPLARGSTVIYPSVEAMRRSEKGKYEHETLYGAMGSPNQHQLEQVIAQIEGGSHCQVVSSGLAACTIPLLGFLSSGDHCLIIDSIYGPTKRFAETVLGKFGVEISYYPADCNLDEIETYIQNNTKLIFTESPGSHSFEIQNIAGTAEIAHSYGAKLILDNTWGIGIFKPFEHGVDISVQALTKYANGHSDLVLGAITVKCDDDWHILRDYAVAMGEVAAPDVCWLTLRGLRTMAARLEKQSVTGLKIAQWCSRQPYVERVLHPALPSCYGHEFWKRDFTGASSVFGVVFKKNIILQKVIEMINHLKFFSIGASWGGYESLVLLTDGEIRRKYKSRTLTGSACRFHIGLENENDLIEDLKQAFDKTLK